GANREVRALLRAGVQRAAVVSGFGATSFTVRTTLSWMRLSGAPGYAMFQSSRLIANSVSPVTRSSVAWTFIGNVTDFVTPRIVRSPVTVWVMPGSVEPSWMFVDWNVAFGYFSVSKKSPEFR